VAEPVVPLRELRNQTSAILRRVESGERLVVTVDRRPVAQLVPLPSPRPWVPAADVWGRVRASQADPTLSAELDQLFDTRVGE
jgi:prevent-host-death family protein